MHAQNNSQRLIIAGTIAATLLPSAIIAAKEVILEIKADFYDKMQEAEPLLNVTRWDRQD